MQKIYIVSAHSGKWSDVADWIVACYFERAFAQMHANAANKWCQELLKDGRLYAHDGPHPENPYDPKCKVDMGVCAYHVEEADGWDHFDQFQELCNG